MRNKELLIIFSFAICIIIAMSSVNAGIFEFSQDTGDELDDTFKISENETHQDSDNDLQEEEFTINISKPDSVQNLISKIESDYDDDLQDAVVWLNKYEDKKVLKTENGEYILINQSETDKIPSSDKYSSCVVKCKVLDENYDSDYECFVVKDIEVSEKTEKESDGESEITTADEDYSSDDSTQTSSDTSSDYKYIGNAATGKFHRTSCRDVNKMDSGNMVYFSSSDEAKNNGYSPCGHCNP